MFFSKCDLSAYLSYCILFIVFYLKIIVYFIIIYEKTLFFCEISKNSLKFRSNARGIT